MNRYIYIYIYIYILFIGAIMTIIIAPLRRRSWARSLRQVAARLARKGLARSFSKYLIVLLI